MMNNNHIKETEPIDTKKRTSQITTTIGVGLVIMGILILAGEVMNIGIGRFIWPFFFILPGTILLVLSNQKSIVNGEPLVIIGSMITMLGLLFFYQSLTNHWASWAYAWALIAPTSFGIGLWWYGKQRNREALENSGKQLAKIGGIIFLAGAVFFEIIIGISKYGQIITPFLIIIVGIYLLYNAAKK